MDIRLEEGWIKVGAAGCEKRGQETLVAGLWWESGKRKSEQQKILIVNGKKIVGRLSRVGIAAMMIARQTYTVKHIRKGLTLLNHFPCRVRGNLFHHWGLTLRGLSVYYKGRGLKTELARFVIWMTKQKCAQFVN